MAKGAVRFRDSAVEADRIKKEILAGRVAPIYLLMGEEPYFIDMLADMLAANLLSEAEREFSQIVLYGRDTEVGTVINAAKQMPMMGSRQVVIVREAQQLRDVDKLSFYAKQPSASSVLVLCHKEKNLDKRTQLYKAVSATGVVFESVAPRDYEIKGWLSDFVKAKGCTMNEKSVSMLVEHLGCDIATISNELDKLILSLPDSQKRIDEEYIEQRVGISKEFNNYELCAAVIGRDMRRALMIADHFAQNPKDNPLLLTIMALFGKFRELFIVNYLRWLSQRKGQPMPSDAEMFALLKINNRYALDSIREGALKWDNRKVFQVLGLMREYDAKSKGLGAGNISEGELLREMLLKIFML